MTPVVHLFNMKFIRALFIIVIVLFCFNTSAQQKNIEAVLAMPDDTAKVTGLLSHSKKIMVQQPALADSLTDIALIISNKLNFSFGRAKSFYSKGAVQHTIFENRKAGEWYEKARATFNELNMPREVNKTNIYLAVVLYRLGEFKKSDSLSLSVMKYAEENYDTAMISLALNNLSISSQKRSDYNASLKYALQAASLNEMRNDRNGLASSFNNIGIILKMQDKFKEAIQYYSKAIELYTEIGDTSRYGQIYGNIGTAYKYLKEYNKSLEAFKKAIRYDKNNSNSNALAGNYNNLSLLYHKMNEVDSAMFYAGKALEINRRTNDLQGMATTYSNLALWYFELDILRN